MYKLILATIFLLIYNCALIFGDKVTTLELVNNWTLRNENGTIDIAVPKLPSGVYSALKSRYGDILVSKNDVDLRWIAYENWTYTLRFSVDKMKQNDRINLTLHGIDTVATIRLNNEDIGYTDNMFVRYSFEVTTKLQEMNKLEVIIMSPVKAAKERAEQLLAQNITQPPNCPEKFQNGECHRNMLRKMQMSFGGDWNLAAPSMGIWKVVTLERYEVAIMRDVDVAVQRNDSHWIMDVRVFLSTGTQQDFYGELVFYAGNLLDEPLNISRRLIKYDKPMIEFKVAILKERVQLWWPNGYGIQKLYPLFFSMSCWESLNGPSILAKTVSQKRLNFGFRTIELVEDLDDFGRSFYFKVNGHPIFMKGANYAAAHILPENLSQSQNLERIKYLLQSAKKANMNMLRVWGGGLYESDYFYNLADNYGLLIWQDMAFYAATYPVTEDFVESVRLETVQNAQRISYHPSLAIIVTNDEVELFLTRNRSSLGMDVARFEQDYMQLFKGTIKHELNMISRNDFNPRPGPMMSTPSLGIEESKKGLPMDPQNPNYGDVHLLEDNKNVFDPKTYPLARFITEYGIQSLPIVASWERTLGAEDTIVDMIKHRQHDLTALNGMLDLVHDWENNVETLIYVSQVGQAVAAKLATDIFRSKRIYKRTMGALYWQLNDVWVAPTWSSIDFFGNYKILYYWQREFLKPITVIPLYDARKRIVNVTMTREDYTEYRDSRMYRVDVHAYLWSELFPKKTVSWDVVLDANGIKQQFHEFKNLVEAGQNENNSFMEFIMSEKIQKDDLNEKEELQYLSSTFLFPAGFGDIEGLRDPQLKYDISLAFCSPDVSNDMRINSYSLSITVTRPALFVYIEINHKQVDKYRLSCNGFVMVEPIKVVHLEFEHKSDCVQLTKDNIRIHTMNKVKMDADNPPTTTTTTTTTTPATTKLPTTSSSTTEPTTTTEITSTVTMETTTAVEETTTDAGETTTVVEETTTIAVETTTDGGETTTVVTETTTDAGETTTVIVETTTDAGETTTAVTEKTTDAGETTTDVVETTIVTEDSTTQETTTIQSPSETSAATMTTGTFETTDAVNTETTPEMIVS